MSADEFMALVARRMEGFADAESLNDGVLIPFTAALETVCKARGYMLNVYGERSNLVVTTEDDAETIYQLVEAYLDDEDAAASDTNGS